MILMPARIVRKILKSGDSKVAALPPDWLRMFKIDIGHTVDLIYNSIVIIKPKNLKIDPEFLRKEFELILNLEEAPAKNEQS